MLALCPLLHMSAEATMSSSEVWRRQIIGSLFSSLSTRKVTKIVIRYLFLRKQHTAGTYLSKILLRNNYPKMICFSENFSWNRACGQVRTESSLIAPDKANLCENCIQFLWDWLSFRWHDKKYEDWQTTVLMCASFYLVS